MKTKVSKVNVVNMNVCESYQLPFWVSRGQCFIFGALCPSMSGLMNKHIVKP